MSTLAVSRSARAVKKVEKPRPLKISGNHNRLSSIDGRFNSVEEVMALVDRVSMNLMNANFDQLLRMDIISLCSNLRMYGQQLEVIYKDQLDRAFVAFRNGCRDERLDYSSRVHLLEVIELRATNWQACDNLINYYKSKTNIDMQDLLVVPDTPTLLTMSPTMLTSSSSPTTPQLPLLGPGEVIKTSGKFAKPTKIPGKNYCKDEVVIRNSDSGKVNPGAKERLVQITGPSEEKINLAKQLIEDTIRRNASPVRLEQPEKERMGGSSSSLNSSASDESNRYPGGARRSALLHSFSTNDASLGEYKYTVTVGNQSIKITGTNLDLVRTAKLVLDEHFNQDPDLVTGDFYTNYEDEPRTPCAPVPSVSPMKLTATSRVDSQESNATSESDETYKAPMNVEAEGSHLTVLRQPLFPDASREAFEQAELSGRVAEASARNRRACFAYTNSQQQTPDSSSSGGIERYSRENLLDLALSPLSQKEPKDWDRILMFSIAKQGGEPFDPVIYAQKCQELNGSSAVLSATETESPDME